MTPRKRRHPDSASTPASTPTPAKTSAPSSASAATTASSTASTSTSTSISASASSASSTSTLASASASTSAPNSASSSASASASGPTSAVSSTSSDSDFKLMKTHLECPVCFEIPRDGVMLQCVNGHNVCASCKDKMGQESICPQGGCGYNDPPTRNRAIGELIDSFRFKLKFPCKHAKSNNKANASICHFEGTKDELGPHEEACQHRPVPCPKLNCKESISAGNVIKHFSTAHKTDFIAYVTGNAVEKSFSWRPENNYGRDGGWKILHLYTSSSGTVLPCAYRRDGLVYLWLAMLAPKSTADKFKCVITLSKDGHVMSFDDVPVYPIDWSKEKIMNDKDCVRLGIWSIGKMLTDDIDDDLKRDGYTSKFTPTFKIIKKTA